MLSEASTYFCVVLRAGKNILRATHEKSTMSVLNQREHKINTWPGQGAGRLGQLHKLRALRRGGKAAAGWGENAGARSAPRRSACLGTSVADEQRCCLLVSVFALSRVGAGGSLFKKFLFFGDSKGKCKSDLLLGSKDLPLSATAPVLPCSFPNKVRAGKVAVIVQPRFHCFLLRRGVAAALHAPRLCSRSRSASSCRRRGCCCRFPPVPALLLPMPSAHRSPLPCLRPAPRCEAGRKPVSGPSAAPAAPQRISGPAACPAAGNRLHLHRGPAAPRGAAAPRPAPPRPAAERRAGDRLGRGCDTGGSSRPRRWRSPARRSAAEGAGRRRRLCARLFCAETDLNWLAQAVPAGMGKKENR